MTNLIPTAKTTSLARIIIADDGYKAFLCWESTEELRSMVEDTLAASINHAGVVFGTRNDLASAVLAENAAAGKIIIAEGVLPIDGKHGWIEYHRNAAPLRQADEKEMKVDFHNLGWIHNVSKGETIAVIHPPESGTPGKTVTGKLVPGKPGKEPPVKLGKFVSCDPDDPHKIIAMTDGNLQIQPGGMVDVEPLLTVRSDVDYSTGDIDFVGAVVVLGDVKTGFSIKAKKSVEIRGSVEDAKIESAEDIVIRKGFIGSGKGVVNATGSVTVQRILNQVVTSGKDIVIGREAICAKLRASEKIVSPNAAFVGCVLEAGTEIEVLNLGIGDQGQAKARVGRRAMILERISANEKEALQMQKQLDDVREGIFKLIRLELDGGPSIDENRDRRSKLQVLQTQLQRALEGNGRERESLKLQLNDTRMARIVVHDTLYSNVFVELNGIKKLITNSLREVILVENGGKIEERSLE